MWVLFILILCGPGCVHVRAVPMPDEATCVRHEGGGPRAVAFCEWREP